MTEQSDLIPLILKKATQRLKANKGLIS